MRLVTLLAVASSLAGCDRVFNIQPIGSTDAAESGDAPPGDGVLFGEVEVAAGADHTCAREGGRVRCWGKASFGRLGYGNDLSIGDNELPRDVGDIDIGIDVVAITTGVLHTCARTVDGKVRCWGAGARGRLGYGNTDSIGALGSPAFAGDVSVGTAVMQVEAGGEHTCALTSAGTVRCWGSGLEGRLGYGNTGTIGDTPGKLPFTAGDLSLPGLMTAISIGDAHTCALDSEGQVRCWGLGLNGRLGYGDSESIGDSEGPRAALDLGPDVVTQISAGDTHTCALLGTNVRCWGNGSTGQLGYGNTSNIGDDELPASIGYVDVGGAVTQVSAGGNHTCAVLASGALRCWGANSFGQLGYGNTEIIGDTETPSSVGEVPVGDTVARVSAGRNHTCAVLTTGAIRCWGANDQGQLGYGNVNNVGDNEEPATAGDVPVF